MGLPCGTYNTSPQEDMAIVRTRTQWVLLALGLAFLATLALYLPPLWVLWLITLGCYVVAALGLHILTGLCGQFSMGHAAFMAVGAYAAAIFGKEYGLPAWATLPIAGVLAGLVGLVFGTPALRIRGFYLVMSTIAAQFMMVWLLRDSPLSEWTGGYESYRVPDIVILGSRIGDVGKWWLTLAVVVVAVVLAKNIQRTSAGRRFIAVRDNDLAAEVMGVNLFRTKLLAFFIGCCFAGVAGWLWAHAAVRSVLVGQFQFDTSLKLLGMVIVGGMGSTTGAVMGAVLISLADMVTTSYISPAIGESFPELAGVVSHSLTLIVFASVVMFFIVVEPRGLYYRFLRLKLFYRLHPFSY
ncbi:MAG: branched-chain amino acid ABC transporter permease [Chloroflexi bacterium]|nr:MAG: branched-chain amino acid ABC transporter permease [Chloroflexota bacterium]RLC93893.1 MAG: branched-chain amino acid ABC transporter permease [Chloroflexota bacterium]